MKTRIRSANSQKANWSTKTTLSATPSVGDIRQRAHQLFLARGSTPGNELDDWLRAEQELKQERTGTDVYSPQS